MILLPKPPSCEEKYRYVNQNKWLVYGIGTISLLVLVAGMVLFSVQHKSTVFYMFFAVLVLVYLSISYFIGIFSKSFSLKEHFKTYSNFDVDSVKGVSVDVYLPCCGEPIEILENTYKYVKELKWYSEDLLRIYVLDDGHSDEVKILASKYGFNYIARENRGYLKKAGNLRYAFSRTNGDYILILDADFCPRPEMLLEMIVYCTPNVAIVQSPQFFSVENGQSWSEKGAGYVQELFYRLIQVNRDHFHAPICVGTCALYRRKALLPFGGTAEIGYSEDMHTGFMVTCAGWRVKYVPIALSKGICPDTLSAYFVQQYRWCMGSFSLFINHEFWSSGISFMQRLCYVSGMLYYMATAIGIFFTPLPSMVMVWFFPNKIFWYNAVFSIPSFIFGTVGMAIWTKNKWGIYSIGTRVVAYFAHVFAMVDKLRNNVMPWVVTGAKEAKASSRYDMFYSMFVVWMVFVPLVTFSGIVFSLHRGGVNAYHFFPTIFFTLFNLFINCVILKEMIKEKNGNIKGR